MRPTPWWPVVAVAVAFAAALAPLVVAEDAPAPTPVPASKPTLADLAWLAGSCRVASDGETFDETWLPPLGDGMVAVSRSVVGGVTKLVELSAIEATDAGIVLRIRHFGPGLTPWKKDAGGAESWPLEAVRGTEAAFTEPSRKFPRTVRYRREPGAAGKPDVLTARLEGEGGPPGGLEFRFERVEAR